MNTLAELKERAMCLWNRLEALEQDRTAFQESVQGTLSDQITQVGTLSSFIPLLHHSVGQSFTGIPLQNSKHGTITIKFPQNWLTREQRIPLQWC